MKLSLTISSLLALATILACAAGQDNDLQALKDTLQALCTANKERAFGACCSYNNNGQDITTCGSIPSCFGMTSTAPNGAILSLFASNAARSLSNELESHNASCQARD